VTVQKRRCCAEIGGVGRPFLFWNMPPSSTSKNVQDGGCRHVEIAGQLPQARFSRTYGARFGKRSNCTYLTRRQFRTFASFTAHHTPRQVGSMSNEVFSSFRYQVGTRPTLPTSKMSSALECRSPTACSVMPIDGSGRLQGSGRNGDGLGRRIIRGAQSLRVDPVELAEH